MSRVLLIANVVAVIAACAWLASFAFPSGRTVRARNAFLLRRGRSSDFEWTPAAVPSDFSVEREAPPKPIADAVVADGVADRKGDWPRALALVALLVRFAKFEGAIQSDLATTYAGIVAGRGYCADFVRVYLAAAPRLDLFCRQWSFSFDGFGGHGHTFVEVFDRERNAWSFLDVHNNVYAVAKDTQPPLDALALRSMLLRSPETVEFRQAAPGRLGWPHAEKLRDYYVRGADQWYLSWGNDVVSREKRGLVGALQRVSGTLAHRLASTAGYRPPIVVLPTAGNESSIARMEKLRSRIVTVAALAIALALPLAAQIVVLTSRSP